MKTTAYLILAFFTLSASTCGKETVSDKNCTEQGTLVDMTGLDGCGLMIQMKDGSRHEVVNWPDSIGSSDAGRSIRFSFEEVTDMGSICMAGKMVRLTCMDLGPKAEECPAALIEDLSGKQGPDFNLISHRTVGTTLKLKIGYSGCSPDRNFRLLLSAAQMKSLPPQNPAVLVFEAQPCEAYFIRELCFNMAVLKDKTLLLIQNGSKTERVLYDPT